MWPIGLLKHWWLFFCSIIIFNSLTSATAEPQPGSCLFPGRSCLCIWLDIYVFMHAFKREQCIACRLSVLKPMSCLKKQHCLHSHICLIHASNAMPFNDNILSGWKVCVCVHASAHECVWCGAVCVRARVKWVWNREEEKERKKEREKHLEGQEQQAAEGERHVRQR